MAHITDKKRPTSDKWGLGALFWVKLCDLFHALHIGSARCGLHKMMWQTIQIDVFAA